MKILAGIGWALAGAALVGLWLFPDAISRWRRMGGSAVEMPADCSLAEGPCTVDLGGGTELALAIDPPSAPAATPLRFEVRVDGPGRPRAIEIQGLEMNMGFFHVPLHAGRRPGTWTATTVLPMCTRRRMAYRADVLVGDGVAGFVFWSRTE